MTTENTREALIARIQDLQDSSPCDERDDALADAEKRLAAMDEPESEAMIARSLFDQVIDCLYEYDLGQELSEHWPHEVRDAIEAARLRLLGQRPSPIARVFIPQDIGWTKERIAEHINEQLRSGDLAEEGDQPLTAAAITDAEAQQFVDGVQGVQNAFADPTLDDRQADAENEVARLLLNSHR